MRRIDRLFADETYVKVAGQWIYLYRAVDQHGQVIDVLPSVRRDLAAARRFFTRALRAGTVPAEITTDRAPAYPRVLEELPRSVRMADSRGRAWERHGMVHCTWLNAGILAVLVVSCASP
jgi:IS6 family transposase